MSRRSARGHSYSYWVQPMPRIRDTYLDCVIYLYPDARSAEAGERVGGSGFLVGIMSEGLPTDFVFLYAITNRHVIERGSRVLRMKPRDGGIDVLDLDERSWVYHPDGDDLAACLVSFDPKAYKFSFVWRRDFVDKNLVADMNIGPGDEAFLVGRFINHEGRQQNLPTARFGCIAQMPNEPIVQDTGFRQESFLVEVRSIGGYSGSPVFVFIPPASLREGIKDWVPLKIMRGHGPWLLGVDWGHINDWEPIRNERGEPVNQTAPKAQHVKMNTGMAAVVPAWKLAELLDSGPLAEYRAQIVAGVLEHHRLNPPSPVV